MAGGRLRAVGDDRGVGQLGAPALADRLHALAHLLAREPVRQLAQQLGGGTHRGVGGGLRAADARELGLGLVSPPQVEGLVVDRQVDAGVAQLVGPGEREVGRHERGLEADLLARAQVGLDLGGQEVDAVVEQRVEPELERVDHLDPELQRLDTVALQHADHRHLALARLEVEERVEDVERDRVEEVGRGGRARAHEQRLAHAGTRIASSRAISSGTWRVKRP